MGSMLLYIRHILSQWLGAATAVGAHTAKEECYLLSVLHAAKAILRRDGGDPRRPVGLL
jgi:hypothetical protein